jgi:hypothetical protein
LIAVHFIDSSTFQNTNVLDFIDSSTFQNTNVLDFTDSSTFKNTNVLDFIDSSTFQNMNVLDFIYTHSIYQGLLNVSILPFINQYLPKTRALIRTFLHNRILIKKNFSLLVYEV